MANVTAYAGVAEAEAYPPDWDEDIKGPEVEKRRRALRAARLLEAVERLTAKVEKQRNQLAEAEQALAEAVAAVEGT